MLLLTIQLVLVGIWLFYLCGPVTKLVTKITKLLKESLDIGSSAALLESYLREQILGRNGGQEIEAIPSYKFYHHLASLLQSQKYRMGISIEVPLKELLSGLGKERGFTAKIRGQFQGSYLQFLLVSFITWSLCFAMSALLELELKMSQRIIILALQLLGLLSFLCSFYFLYQKVFQAFSAFFELFYTCRSLWSANFPIGEIGRIMAKIQVRQTKLMKPLYAKFTQVMELGTTYGTVGDSDVTLLLSELWDLHELSLENFIRRLMVIKFIHLIIFFVSSYFLLLYFTLDQLQI